jgi:hypothetical protein
MSARSKFILGIVCFLILVFCSWTHAAILQKGPYLIYPDTNTEMTVLWQTDETPGNSMVEWGTTTAYGSSSGSLTEIGSGSNEHQFSYTITGLDIATPYYYRVTVDAQPDTGSFMSAPSDTAKTVTIYGYGDTRSNPDDHNSVVQQLMGDVDGDAIHQQTIVLHSADWVNNGDNESDWTDEYFNRSYPNSLDFMSRKPVMGSRGNHEGSGVLLRKYWPYDYQDGSGCYYSFDYGPVHVTVIDQYVSFAPGSAQYIWLENDLATTQKLWKLVILHEPAWSAAGGHSNDIDTQQDLCPLFEQYEVAVVHAGHNHYYARGEVNGVQHITAGGGGAPLRTPDPGQPNIVMTDESLHFIKYEISGGRMTVTAIRSDGSVIESFEVVKQMQINAMPWRELLLLEN